MNPIQWPNTVARIDQQWTWSEFFTFRLICVSLISLFDRLIFQIQYGEFENYLKVDAYSDKSMLSQKIRIYGDLCS